METICNILCAFTVGIAIFSILIITMNFTVGVLVRVLVEVLVDIFCEIASFVKHVLRK